MATPASRAPRFVSLQVKEPLGTLIAGETGRDTHSIRPDDPLSARMTTHWTQEIRRDDISLRTETWSAMHASAGHFHLTARIEAWRDDTLVFERDFAEDIDRDFN